MDAGHRELLVRGNRSVDIPAIYGSISQKFHVSSSFFSGLFLRAAATPIKIFSNCTIPFFPAGCVPFFLGQQGCDFLLRYGGFWNVPHPLAWQCPHPTTPPPPPAHFAFLLCSFFHLSWTLAARFCLLPSMQLKLYPM